jgi:hypothetical protein
MASPVNAPPPSTEAINGGIRCSKCGKWCRSQLGLKVHYGKVHMAHPKKPKVENKPLTLWDLRYGGKRLDL